MIRRLTSLACFALAGVFLVSTSASAQGGTLFSLQGSGLYQGLSGDAYAAFGGGIGAEGQIRINLANGRSVGVGLQFSSHANDEELGYDAPLTLFGVFVEPRILVAAKEGFAPYLSARLALLNQATEIGSGSVSASGVQVNGGGGVLFAVTQRIDIDVGATIGAVKFGSYSTSGADAGSGMNFVLRVGVSLALGK